MGKRISDNPLSRRYGSRAGRGEPGKVDAIRFPSLGVAGVAPGAYPSCSEAVEAGPATRDISGLGRDALADAGVIRG